MTADHNVTSIARTTAAAPFFEGMNAEYTVAPGATALDLLQDLQMLLGSGLGVFETLAQSVDSTEGCNSQEKSAYWAGVYMLRQAAALAHAADFGPSNGGAA
ncbi:MAG: hypothetical protein Q8M01_15440 [Rubrivivax sp.]|nr:hypothetical protein [Rubrivivax sp.]